MYPSWIMFSLNCVFCGSFISHHTIETSGNGLAFFLTRIIFNMAPQLTMGLRLLCYHCCHSRVSQIPQRFEMARLHGTPPANTCSCQFGKLVIAQNMGESPRPGWGLLGRIVSGWKCSSEITLRLLYCALCCGFMIFDIQNMGCWMIKVWMPVYCDSSETRVLLSLFLPSLFLATYIYQHHWRHNLKCWTFWASYLKCPLKTFCVPASVPLRGHRALLALRLILFIIPLLKSFWRQCVVDH